MMDKRREGIRCGIPSYCSANELVIEIALRRAKERNIPVLIEATANQVNQFGGYTGMKPADFYQMVLKMASDIGLPENMMILAGDHLGPLTWQKLPESEAMENSVTMRLRPSAEPKSASRSSAETSDTASSSLIPFFSPLSPEVSPPAPGSEFSYVPVAM